MSGSGTGTPASGGTTSFVNLVDRVETAVNDAANAEWSTAELATFLNDAIRDYSKHFPRVRRTDLTTVADQHEYDLPADVSGALLGVEFPQGEEPPTYLELRSRYGPAFWGSVGYYDVIMRGDQTDVDVLVLSEDVAADETVRAEYVAHHALISNVTAISGYSSVPVQHEDLLIKYVIWQCSVQLQMAEEQSPTSSSSLLMAQYAANARRNRQQYEDALRQAIYAAEGRSAVVSWHEGSGGRIY